MTQNCSGKNLGKIEKRFLKKHHLDETTGRVYEDEHCRVHKEVWMYGLGWVSEARFKRYLQQAEPY